MNKQELIEKLISLDEEVSMIFQIPEKIKMTVVGGGALILQNVLNRSTMDIDLIDVYFPALFPLMEKYDINCRSNDFSDCLAENYCDRLIKLDIKTKAIDYYLLSLEDLVIMKLFSDRERDRIDIRNEEVVNNLNWELLDKIISSGEADVSFNTARYKDFLKKYEDYRKEYYR